MIDCTLDRAMILSLLEGRCKPSVDFDSLELWIPEGSTFLYSFRLQAREPMAKKVRVPVKVFPILRLTFLTKKFFFYKKKYYCRHQTKTAKIQEDSKLQIFYNKCSLRLKGDLIVLLWYVFTRRIKWKKLVPMYMWRSLMILVKNHLSSLQVSIKKMLGENWAEAKMLCDFTNRHFKGRGKPFVDVDSLELLFFF